MAQDAEPIQYGIKLRKDFSVKRMQEFGAKHVAFKTLNDNSLVPDADQRHLALQTRLNQPISSLDLTDFQKSKLKQLQLSTIGEVLSTEESEFLKLHYIGDIRAREMRNAAVTAVIEYLSG